MPSFTAISAAAILAFSGMASAIPQYNFANGTSSAVPAGSSGSARPSGSVGSGAASGSNSTVPALAESAYCPGLNGQLVGNYLIECSTTHFGTILEISNGNGTVNGTIAKRAVYTSLGDCINLCSATTSCVGSSCLDPK